MNASKAIRHESRRALPLSIRRRNRTILENLGVAGMVASRQAKRGPEYRDDLQQEAAIGLIRGVERFTPDRGYRISTYLASCANGQVMHYRRDRAGIIRIPWRLRDLHWRGQRLQDQRRHHGQPLLTDQEMADALGITTDRWLAANRSHQAERLDSLEDLNESSLGMADDHDPERTWLVDMFSQLESQERQLLQHHYVHGESLRQLAFTMGTTPRRLRKQLRILLTKLRRWAEQDGLLPVTAPGC